MAKVAICPTITAFEPHQYRIQMERIEPFAKRVHIDLMDGKFAPTQSPGLDQVWWSGSLTADIHLMYQQPMEEIEALIKLCPALVVIHYEADVDHRKFTDELHKANIKVGLAILHDTPVEDTFDIVPEFDHALVFSGDLGKHGGEADLNILSKVRAIRYAFPEVEIGWDGGINDQNVKQLVEAGVTVLNVGGFIHGAKDPKNSYEVIQSSLD
jgi:ribulose-phosphate 3-epimerase